ncbi:hypothetical protein ACQFX9_26625 [Aliinostoc sp. HNIBRCY26]|uniref:hypothetical protein n=1 Tax=Aliinostoc sp. HNIBRCY26 TaxID=3418997 RepID=UPI003CFFDC27
MALLTPDPDLHEYTAFFNSKSKIEIFRKLFFIDFRSDATQKSDRQRRGVVNRISIKTDEFAIALSTIQFNMFTVFAFYQLTRKVQPSLL